MTRDYEILFAVEAFGTEMKAVILYPETGRFALGRFDVSQRGGAYVEVLCGEEPLSDEDVAWYARSSSSPLAARYRTAADVSAQAAARRPQRQRQRVLTDLFERYTAGQMRYMVAIDPETGCFHDAKYLRVSEPGKPGMILQGISAPLTAAQVRAFARQSDDRRAERYRDIDEKNWRGLIR